MRLPVTTDLKSRMSSPNIDARLINALLEEKADGPNARKRPGMLSTGFNYTGVQGLGVGLGGFPLIIYQDNFVINDWLWTSRYYPAGAYVWYLGTYYVALIDNTGAVPTGGAPNWQAVTPYSGSTTYGVGDAVLSDGDWGDNENGSDVVWFAVASSTGVTPRHSLAAYPYWSRYKAKPTGTHPTMTYVDTAETTPPSPGPGDFYLVRRTEVNSGGGYSVSYQGTATHLAGFPPYPAPTVIYSNFIYGQSFINGYDDAFGSHQTNDPSPYYAAQDYARSHLA